MPIGNTVQLLLKLLQHRFDDLLRRALLDQFIRLREQIALQAVTELAVLRDTEPIYRCQAVA
ncbi:hypothetical protein D3C75_1386050 [compost metagenome]